MTAINKPPPLVEVTTANLREGTRGRGWTWREWDLILACGCSDSMPARYRPGTAGRGWAAMHYPASVSDVLPAPRQRRHLCPKK